MALRKKIIQEDGIATDYHRILYIQNAINACTSIAVMSYIGADTRVRESEGMETYRQATTYTAPYTEDMTPGKAYDFLKTLEEFKDAEDV